MAGIMKDGKVYGGTVSDDHIKNVVSEDLDKKVDKTQIVTSVSSTSTDIQVPSAKTIYNILNSKLSSATKGVTDLNDTLTNGYYQLAGSSTSNNVYTDCWGIMHVITNGASPTESWFWIWQIVYDNSKNRIYYRKKIATSGNWSKWKFLISTSVEDVGLTRLKLESDFSGDVFYQVKGGYCTVYICNLTCTITGNGQVVSNDLLPNPVAPVVTSPVEHDSSDIKVGLSYIDIDIRLLKMHVYKNAVNGYATFSYPVAES